MISQFADQAKVQNIFSKAPELEKFVFEFCQQFKCAVQEPIKATRLSSVAIVTADGLPCGRLMFDPEGERDKETGKRVPVYYYESPIVRKAKGSARSASDCRDSITIKGLIAAVKKHNEGPSRDKLQVRYSEGIRYAFNSARKNNYTDRLGVRDDATLALMQYYLQVDTNSIRQYDDVIKREYEKYLLSAEQSKQSMNTFQRFCKGSYVIGVMRTHHDSEPYYLVGEASWDEDSNKDTHEKITFHAPLKRYSSLMNCPEVAPHVPIIAAWASGQTNRDDAHELKLPRSDHYWEDVDVSGGYATGSECWYLIPKAYE